MYRYKNLRANIFFVLQYVTRYKFSNLAHTYWLTCTEQIPACGAGAGGGTAARDAGAGCPGLFPVGADGCAGVVIVLVLLVPVLVVVVVVLVLVLVVLLVLVGAAGAGGCGGGSVGKMNFGTSFAYLVRTQT